MNELLKTLNDFQIEYKLNEPMSLHTTFKVGGNADVMVFPESEGEIAEIVKCCNNNNIHLVTAGNGSNMLVDDSGISGAVMVLDNHFADVRVDGCRIVAQAGAPLIKVCKAALDNGLTGLEFAYGIPGSCGGAAFMNAGAYGGEMKDVLTSCRHIDKMGNEGELKGDDLELSYRHSAYYDLNAVITELTFELKPGDKEEIKDKMQDFLGRRRDKQPLEYPSAGSTFKRPPGNFAGALIEQCGLKGKSVGGAQVSEKHAGFVINKGGATCKDILDLCKLCCDTVYDKTGVHLEMEIRVTK